MHQCPYFHSAERQVKSGFDRTGTQRLQCQSCRRQYTPEPNPLGYDEKTRFIIRKEGACLNNLLTNVEKLRSEEYRIFSGPLRAHSEQK
jgi:hypothetical protein